MVGIRRATRELPPPTQEQVIVRGFVEEEVAILDDGTLVQVIEVGAVDLDMMDQDGQGWLIRQFREFLSGLKFPIQVVIASEAQDISPWIEVLTEAAQQWEERLSAVSPDAPVRAALERLAQRAWDRVEWVERIHRLVAPLAQRYYLVICENSLPIRSRRRQLTETLYRQGRKALDRKRYYMVESLSELGLSARVLNQADLTAILSHFYRRRVKSLHQTPKLSLRPLIYTVEGEADVGSRKQVPASPEQPSPAMISPSTRRSTESQVSPEALGPRGASQSEQGQKASTKLTPLAEAPTEKGRSPSAPPPSGSPPSRMAPLGEAHSPQT